MVNATTATQWNIGSDRRCNWWCIVVSVWTILIVMRSRASIALDLLSCLRLQWTLICLMWSTALVALDRWSRGRAVHIPSLGVNWRCLVHWDMLITLNNIMAEVTHVFVLLIRGNWLFNVGFSDRWVGFHPSLGQFFHHHLIHGRNSWWRWLRS